MIDDIRRVELEITRHMVEIETKRQILKVRQKFYFSIRDFGENMKYKCHRAAIILAVNELTQKGIIIEIPSLNVPKWALAETYANSFKCTQ